MLKINYGNLKLNNNPLSDLPKAPNENDLTAHIRIEEVSELPTNKKALKEELKKHNINHSELEFELIDENCIDQNKQ